MSLSLLENTVILRPTKSPRAQRGALPPHLPPLLLPIPSTNSKEDLGIHLKHQLDETVFVKFRPLRMPAAYGDYVFSLQRWQLKIIHQRKTGNFKLWLFGGFDLNYLTCLCFGFSVCEICLTMCDTVYVMRECCKNKSGSAVGYNLKMHFE